MTSYMENDFGHARWIVERFLDEDRPEGLDLGPNMVVSDVEADAAEFVGELTFLRDFGEDVPAVRLHDEEPVPVALTSLAPVLPSSFFANRLWRQGFPPDWRSLFLGFLEERRRRSPEAETIAHGEARSTFLRRATEFLATRLAAVRGFEAGPAYGWSQLTLPQRLGGPRVSTPGCNFTVATNSAGLRVFWSPAYRISTNYFNHPTTPTGSVLQSGTYVFGVDGGAYGNQLQWDLNAVVSLPGPPAVHLNF